MNNRTLIILIVIIAAATIIIVSWRTPTTNPQPTPTPTATATPSPTDIFTPTETGIVTPTATPTTSPTTTATPTPTPTPTTSGSFTDIIDTNWVYGVTEQTVGSGVYFIDPNNPTKVKKGASAGDSSATTVFTSDTSGDVGTFYVNGGYLYVTTTRDSSTGHSKFQRVILSSGSKAKLYEFSSSKYEMFEFAVKKSNDTKSAFYIGLKGVADKSEPAGMYVKGYVQQWIKPFTGVAKTAAIVGLAPTSDATKLAGLFQSGSTQSQAYIEL